jgi:hypothetical protein
MKRLLIGSVALLVVAACGSGDTTSAFREPDAGGSGSGGGSAGGGTSTGGAAGASFGGAAGSGVAGSAGDGMGGSAGASAGGTSGAGGTAAGGTSGSGGSATCTEANTGVPACDACLNEKCCPEIKACAANPTCVNLIECLRQKCANVSQSQFTQCALTNCGQYAGAATAALAIRTCQQNNCPTECQ